jgi:hypothetical protein
MTALGFWMDKITDATMISVSDPDDTLGITPPIFEGTMADSAEKLADGEYPASLFGDPRREFGLVVENGSARVM